MGENEPVLAIKDASPVPFLRFASVHDNFTCLTDVQPLNWIHDIMHCATIQFIDLTHESPEFDAAYEIISRDISPEFLETGQFLKNRLRVRDEGPKSEHENVLIQDGYTLHLITAEKDGKVLGAVYGHLIANIGAENRGIGFVTYISVLSKFRRQGIGTGLIKKIGKRMNEDALRITGRPAIGMVFEIEKEGKEAIEGCVSKLHGRPLDIVYFQPALRLGCEPEQMNLWYQSWEPEITAEAATKTFIIAANILTSMVRNMLVKEYVGPEMTGFDLTSKPYTEFVKSIGDRQGVGFLVGY
jgi:hypothetical protein